MKAHILTPVGPVFDGEVEGVQMPGVNGGFEVLKGHAPLVSLLDIGKLVVKTADHEQLVFAVSGGFTEISEDVVTILAEEAIPSDKIDREAEERQREEAEAELAKHLLDTEGHKAAEIELKKIKNRIKVSRN